MQAMQPAERVQAVFDGRPTDRVPVHHIGISSRAASVLIGREAHVGGGIQQWRESVALWAGEEAHAEFIERSFQDALAVAEVCDQDIVRSDYWRMGTKPDKRIDEYTFLYGDDERYTVRQLDPEAELYQIIDERPKEELSLEDIEAQVSASEKSVADYRPSERSFATPLRAREVLGETHEVRFAGVALGIPYLDRAWMEAIALRPSLVGRHLDIQVERAIRNVEFLSARGIRRFWGGGDFASKIGPFYSPRAFHELMLPRLRRISDACHQHGGYHLFASDGNLWPVAEDLFGASGLDGYYEIDRLAGMDLKKLRERFPKLALIGANISSQTLHLGTPDDVAEETLSCLEDAKKLGRIIVGCSNQIVSMTPPENLRVMTELLDKHR